MQRSLTQQACRSAHHIFETKRSIFCFPDFFTFFLLFLNSLLVSISPSTSSQKLSSGILRVSKQKTLSCTKARLDIATGLNKESRPPPIDELLRDKWEFRLGISKCKSGPVPSGNGYHKWCCVMLSCDAFVSSTSLYSGVIDPIWDKLS